MNPQHKLSKQLARERRLQRRVIHKDLGNKLEPAEATPNTTSTLRLPSGNLLLVAHLKISNDSTSYVTRALRGVVETTLAVAQAS